MKYTQKTNKLKKFFSLNENLEKLENGVMIAIFFLFVFNIVLSIVFNQYSNIFCIVIGCMVICALLITKFIETKKEQNKRTSKLTKIADYQKKDYLVNIILNLIVCVYFAVILTYAFSQKGWYLDKWNLCSVNIGLYSFIFVVYTFILPTYKKEIKNVEQQIETQLKSRSNQKKREFLMSEIYFFKKRFNSLTANIIVNGIMFVVSVLSTLIATNLLVQILLATSILFCSYNVLNLLFEFRRLFNFDLKEYE